MWLIIIEFEYWEDELRLLLEMKFKIKKIDYFFWNWGVCVFFGLKIIGEE